MILCKSYSLAIGRRCDKRTRNSKKAKDAWQDSRGCPTQIMMTLEAKALVEARQAEVTRWEEVHHTYRGHLETLSLTLHPFHIVDSTPQTSAQVHSQLQRQSRLSQS